MVSSSTGSSVNQRQARWRWTTSKKSFNACAHRRGANEFTYMIRSASCQPQYENASLPCTPKRASTSGVIELERVLWFCGVHLVEVHEAGIATGDVLVRRDHGIARDAHRGDPRDVHEVAPVAQLLRAVGRRRTDEHERQADRGLARQPSLPGSWRAPEVVSGDGLRRIRWCDERARRPRTRRACRTRRAHAAGRRRSRFRFRHQVRALDAVEREDIVDTRRRVLVGRHRVGHLEIEAGGQTVFHAGEVYEPSSFRVVARSPLVRMPKGMIKGFSSLHRAMVSIERWTVSARSTAVSR